MARFQASGGIGMARHYFGAQALPLQQGRVVCLNCGSVAKIGQWPTGKRAKCSPTLRLAHLPNGATGQQSMATGMVAKRTDGHSGYRGK
jgi:hypothetical protein